MSHPRAHRRLLQAEGATATAAVAAAVTGATTAHIVAALFLTAASVGLSYIELTAEERRSAREFADAIAVANAGSPPVAIVARRRRPCAH